MAEFPLAIWQTAVALLVTLLSVVCAGHALLNKREPRAALGWVAVSMLVPIMGPVLYVLFGINRVAARARRLYQPESRLEVDSGRVPNVAPHLEPLSRLAEALQGWPLAAGNCVVYLHDAADVYEQMQLAICGARDRICLSSYIFDTGSVGERFVDVLAGAVERGVDVRVLVDGVGEFYSLPRIGRLLKRRGVPFRRFNPPTLLPPSLQVNLRNHRKLLVVDDDFAFAGGMNIGDRHVRMSKAAQPQMKDMHLRLEGPVVAQLLEVFLRDWERTTGERLPGRQRSQSTPGAAQPEESAVQLPGSCTARVLTSGPGEDMDKLTMVLTGAVATARRRVLIMTPYFLPPRELLGALVAAALRGVDVSVVLPARNNLPPVHWASQHGLWELLRHGVRVFYQPGPFDHSKVFVVDSVYAQMGSANLDPRSLRLNFELMVELYDSQIAGALAEHCMNRRMASHEVTLQEVDARSLPRRLRDSLAWLFSPYL